MSSSSPSLSFFTTLHILYMGINFYVYFPIVISNITFVHTETPDIKLHILIISCFPPHFYLILWLYLTQIFHPYYISPFFIYIYYIGKRIFIQYTIMTVIIVEKSIRHYTRVSLKSWFES